MYYLTKYTTNLKSTTLTYLKDNTTNISIRYSTYTRYTKTTTRDTLININRKLLLLLSN